MDKLKGTLTEMGSLKGTLSGTGSLRGTLSGGGVGHGIPAGGEPGQGLIKVSDADYDVKWMSILPEDTASGSVASFPDGADDLPIGVVVDIDPVQDLHGYDNPWPGGGGKNLIRPTTDQTSLGVTYTNNSDGSATVNGTSTGAFICYYYRSREEIPFDTEGTWTLSGINSNITGECYIQATVCNKSDDSISSRRRITQSSPTLTFTVTSEEYILSIFFRMSNGSSATNAKIYPMIERSSAPTTFAPYSNICPISGRTGAKVTRTGRNLLDINRVQGTPIPSTLLESPRVMETNKWYKGIRADNYYYTGYANCTIENNVLTVHTFSNVNYGIGFPVSCEPNTTYTISAEQTGCNFSVGCYDKDWNFLSRIKGVTIYVSPLSFTTPSNAEYITVIIGSAVNGEGTATNIQLELGSTAHAYETYTAVTHEIPFSTSVYGGKLDVETGELVVDKEMKVLNGSESWSVHKGIASWFYADNIIQPLPFMSSYEKDFAITNSYIQNIYAQASTLESGKFVLGSPDGKIARLVFKDTQFSTVQEWKDALSANNVQLVYKLATPITITLSPVEIRSLLWDNNVWADTGDVSVTYKADVQKYIDKKISAAVAAMS